jgi:holo-[acyl-carrier protein] synthase
MLEIGTDIADIARFEKMVSNDAFLNKYFHPCEISYSLNSAHPAQHLAVRFAAKEAVRKVLLSHMDELSWKDSWVENNAEGKPILIFSETVHKKIRIRHTSLSLSHTATMAIAVLILDFERS